MHCKVVYRYILIFIVSITIASLMVLEKTDYLRISSQFENSNRKIIFESWYKKRIYDVLFQMFPKEIVGGKGLDKESPVKDDVTSVKHDVRSACPKLPVPRTDQADDSWQPVSERNDAYVYSAFLDLGHILLVGIRKAKAATHNLTCQVWYQDVMSGTVAVETQRAGTRRILGGERHTFTPAYTICPTAYSRNAFAVSIVDGVDVCGYPSNVFRVHQAPPTGSAQFNFTVCVPPVRDDYPSAHRLIEWMEMNRVLGVQLFTFYNESINSHVAPIFKQYEKQGIVEIFHWNLPTREVHYGGQVASMYDCLHRHKGRAKFTGFLDLDEFLIPHSAEDMTWGDMLKRLPPACSYSFRSSFFPGNYTYDGNWVTKDTLLKQSYLLNHLRRKRFIHNHQERSKSIVRPEQITSFSVHVTYNCNGGARIELVSPDVGLVHHYRNDELVRKGTVWDNTTLKYENVLREQFIKILENYWILIMNNTVKLRSIEVVRNIVTL